MTWAELVAAAEEIRRAAADQEPMLAELRLVGLGWATVEAERAFEELASLGVPAAWGAQERDAQFGASVWRREPAPDGFDGPALFVLEPDTEGRLAAFLARFGEGVAAAFLAGRGEQERIVPVNPRWGPFAIVRSRSG
jgi:hypothetical protein